MSVASTHMRETACCTFRPVIPFPTQNKDDINIYFERDGCREPTELRGQMLKQEAGINSKLSVFHNGQVFNLHKNSLNLRIHKEGIKSHKYNCTNVKL